VVIGDGRISTRLVGYSHNPSIILSLSLDVRLVSVAIYCI
jgi:hypothetical protein